MFGIFKNKKENAAEANEQAVFENKNYKTSQGFSEVENSAPSLDDYDDISTSNEGDFDDEEENDVFAEFTDKVQSLIDDGAISLEIAEEKTEQLSELDPESAQYSVLIEEIKIAQANARQNFDDAEFLIKKANEILQENKA